MEGQCKTELDGDKNKSMSDHLSHDCQRLYAVLDAAASCSHLAVW